MDIEVFNDPCYFDMWCVRCTEDRDFNATMHFLRQEQAHHAKAVLSHWFDIHRRKVLLEAAERIGSAEFMSSPEASKSYAEYNELRRMAEEE